MSKQTEKEEGNLSFELAYKRLEEILTELNQGEVSLEKSLKLYEEADRLILSCNQKLVSAEQKMQTLIKNRTGELKLNAQGYPATEDLHAKQEEILMRSLDNSYEPTP